MNRRSPYNYGREREITFLWKEHSRPFCGIRSCDQRSTLAPIREKFDIANLFADNSILLLPECVSLRRRRRTGCKTCGTQGTREPRPFPQPMEPMEEETSEYTRMGKLILDEVITCVLATWSGGKRARENRSIT